MGWRRKGSGSRGRGGEEQCHIWGRSTMNGKAGDEGREGRLGVGKEGGGRGRQGREGISRREGKSR